MYAFIHLSLKCVSQGNGHERDFLGDERVYIMDMYNKRIYPRDSHAKHAIRKMVELNHHTKDQTYLDHIRKYVTSYVCLLRVRSVRCVALYCIGKFGKFGDLVGIAKIKTCQHKFYVQCATRA